MAKEQLLGPLYWPDGSTAASGYLRSLIASSTYWLSDWWWLLRMWQAAASERIAADSAAGEQVDRRAAHPHMNNLVYWSLAGKGKVRYLRCLHESESRPEALYNLGSGSWLAGADDNVKFREHWTTWSTVVAATPRQIPVTWMVISLVAPSAERLSTNVPGGNSREACPEEKLRPN